MYKQILASKSLKSFAAVPKRLFNSSGLLSSQVATGSSRHSGESTLEKTTASTVIIGGGVVGTSIAYHLARQGEEDVILLEKTELTAGSTWHAAGLATSYHPTINLKRIHHYSLNMYSKIAAETDQEVGFHQPGSIRIACKPTAVEEFKFQMAKAAIQDAPQFLLTPDEIKKKIPLINSDKILMGLYTPYDGHIDPYSLTQAIAKGARKYGASVYQGTEVTSLDLKENGDWKVGTSKGDINARRVINAAGFWAKEVGALTGLDLPLVPVQHQYLVTSSVPEIQALEKEFPVLRLIEGSCYVRQERDGFLIGPYESVETMKLNESWSTEGVPKGFGKELFQSDMERMMPHLEQAMDLIPAVSTANIQSIVNGPITYTPDGLPMVGPSIQPNMWLAVGFGYGIIHGGGIGKFLSDWILEGEPMQDLIQCDPGRFGSWTTNDFVFAKARESYGMNNAPVFPHDERFAGRPTSRVTSAYEKQKERGGSMVIDSGWEHPAWFASPGEKPEYKPSFRRPHWHSAVEREWKTVVNSAGVIDLSPFGKFIISGDQAASFLDRVTANRVPSVGKSVVSHMLTPRGKVYAEVTITQTDPGRFMFITGGGSEIHDWRWLKEIARTERWNVNFENVSDTVGCLSVAGPKSKEILSALHPRFKDKFPFFTADKLDIRGINVNALRLTYTGELGWELYHPLKETGKLYEAILDVGENMGLGDFGSYTLNVLRLEKGFRLWSKEMTHDTSVIESGLMGFVDMTKKDFIGKSTIEKELKDRQKRELVMLKIDSKADSDPLGDESIWVGSKVVGNTTSGCFSYHLGQPLAFAYLPPFLTTPGTTVQVEMMNEKHEAEVLPRPPELTYNEKLAAKKKKKL